MSKVVVVTDSSCAFTQEEAKKIGVEIVPLPFYINGEIKYEDVDLTQDDFYKKLQEGVELKTSMPLLGDVTDKWDELLEKYDEVVYIPLSAGLSSSCETAIMLSQDYDGKVQVVNNKRVSVTLKRWFDLSATSFSCIIPFNLQYLLITFLVKAFILFILCIDLSFILFHILG